MTFKAFRPVLSVVLLVTAAVGILNAQTRPTLLVDLDHRTTLSLDGDWHIIVDPYASGIYDFRSPRRVLPGIQDNFNRKGVVSDRGIVASFALGASAVQLGTAYLFCPEARVPPLYRKALEQVGDNGTALTNLFSGRPARGILNRYMVECGLVSDAALAFPHAATLVAPLRAASENAGSVDYMQMWAGQSAQLAKLMGAEELTRKLARDALGLWDRV